jgi:hypothetical protein
MVTDRAGEQGSWLGSAVKRSTTMMFLSSCFNSRLQEQQLQERRFFEHQLSLLSPPHISWSMAEIFLSVSETSSS